MSNQIAATIQSQIGNKALYMMGAKNLATGGNDLSFRIQGSKKINHIKIALKPDDTYSITFTKIKKFDFVTVAEFDGIYADTMHGLIEKNTGLYLSI